MNTDPLWDAPIDPADVHTAANAVPPLDDDLAGALDDLAGVHPGIDLICDGARLLATDRLTANQTQTILSTIAGADANVLHLLGLLVQRLTDPASNPALAHLTPDTGKKVRQRGEHFAYDLAHLAPGDHTSEAAALIDGI